MIRSHTLSPRAAYVPIEPMKIYDLLPSLFTQHRVHEHCVLPQRSSQPAHINMSFGHCLGYKATITPPSSRPYYSPGLNVAASVNEKLSTHIKHSVLGVGH